MRFAAVLAFVTLLPLTAFAALININTADSATLQTLSGIGPSKAQAIIDYRTQHGPFAKIEDIQNVSGIGPSTYANIQAYITVSDSGVTPTATTTTPTTTTAPSGGGAATYVPPPSAIAVTIEGDHTALLNVPLHLSAQATLKNGSIDSAAQLTWSFGDGSMQTGTQVEKIYRYPGTYLVTVRATDGSAKASNELLVSVQTASVGVATTAEGVVVANASSNRIDLSNWRLTSGTGTFRIPEGTLLLPQVSTLFPWTITNLPVTSEVSLLYPDGVLTAHSASPVAPALQPSSVDARSTFTQEQITSSVAKPTQHVEPVLAPAASSELAAAGAPIGSSSAPAAMAAPATTGSIRGLFSSPWLMGLAGLVVVAGGAFIFI